MLQGLRQDGCAFLASVTSAAEAVAALNSAADLIDAKDPATGALGALPRETLRAIIAAVAGRRPVSATIGDLPADAELMCAAAEATASTGVDIVKAGFFGDGDPRAALAALGQANLKGARLVAVLMADRNPDFSLLPALATAGFAGVMLDTADKSGGALPDVLSEARLVEFLRAAHANGLAAGLAGSLRRQHIAALVNLKPGILGFRGALCGTGRASALDAALVKAVRDAIDVAKAARFGHERSVA